MRLSIVLLPLLVLGCADHATEMQSICAAIEKTGSQADPPEVRATKVAAFVKSTAKATQTRDLVQRMSQAKAEEKATLVAQAARAVGIQECALARDIEDQVFRADMASLCDAWNKAGAQDDGMAEGSPKVTAFLQQTLKGSRARAVVSSLATATPEEKKANLDKAAKEAGLASCDFLRDDAAQDFRADMKDICHVVERAGAQADAPDVRAQKVTAYLATRIRTERARGVWSSLATATPEQKGTLVKTASEEAGLAQCPLVADLTGK